MVARNGSLFGIDWAHCSCRRQINLGHGHRIIIATIQFYIRTVRIENVISRSRIRLANSFRNKEIWYLLLDIIIVIALSSLRKILGLSMSCRCPPSGMPQDRTFQSCIAAGHQTLQVSRHQHVDSIGSYHRRHTDGDHSKSPCKKIGTLMSSTIAKNRGNSYDAAVRVVGLGPAWTLILRNWINELVGDRCKLFNASGDLSQVKILKIHRWIKLLTATVKGWWRRKNDLWKQSKT